MPETSVSRLRAARDRMGLSREKVAAQIGVSSKTIERWEDGRSPLKRYRAERLAEVYGVDVDDLMEPVAA